MPVLRPISLISPHAKVRSGGGVLALVLPASFLQGEAWSAARQLFEEHYRDVVVISIATTGATDCAFSADTGMAEVLVIATKQGDAEGADWRTLFVNLLRRPQTILEAKTIARSIRRIPSNRSVGGIVISGRERAGCSIRGALSETGFAGVREVGLTQAATGLGRGELRLPRRREAAALSVVRLKELGRRGLLHRDINGTGLTRENLPRGPFKIVSSRLDEVPSWPALWAHAAARETRMIVLPDSAGEALPRCEDRAAEVWERTASRLHFSLDFRLNSQPLAACLTPDLSIGGRAWPNFLCADRRWEIPLVLWANSTLGLVSFWWIGARQQQGRAILTISKLPALPVLDPRSLTTIQLDLASEIFDQLQDQPMLPANEAWRDDVRHALDRAVLTRMLGLPEDIMEPLGVLRRQWCAEPSVHGGKGTAPVGGATTVQGPRAS